MDMLKLGKRIAFVAVAAVGLVGLSVSTAGAANLPFEGVLTVQTGAEEPTAEDEIIGTGTSTVNDTTGAFTVPTGVFTATQTGTNSNPRDGGGVFIASTTVTISNGPGDLTTAGGFDGGFGGLMNANGSSKNRVRSTGGSALLFTVTVPLSPIGTTPGTTSTTVTRTGLLLVGSVTVQLHGSPWGTGTTTLTDFANDAGGGDQNTTFTVMGSGFDNRDSSGLGTVQLVSPFTVDIDSPSAAAQNDEVGIATLNMTFVPEPGTLLLLGGGVAGLAVLGRKRRS